MNRAILANNPAVGRNTAVVVCATTTGTTRALAVPAATDIMSRYTGAVGVPQGFAAPAGGLSLCGILYSAPAGSAVHLYTTNSLAAAVSGIIIAAGETRYFPISHGDNIWHACNAEFSVMVFFNEAT